MNKHKKIGAALSENKQFITRKIFLSFIAQFSLFIVTES